MTRISVPLDKTEFSALVDMAAADYRHPREQMRFILREEAKRRHLLPTDTAQPVNMVQPSTEADHVRAA